jgi:hypothetical protein
MMIICGAVGGNRIDKEERSTWRISAAVPLCTQQILYDLTGD